MRRTASRGRAKPREGPLFPSFSCKALRNLYTWRVKQAARPERRSAARVRPSRSARLLDVSSLGLSIETTAPLEKDRVYELILRLDDQRMPATARVLRLRKNGEMVHANLVFERLLESDRALLEQSLVREVAERMTVIIR